MYAKSMVVLLLVATVACPTTVCAESAAETFAKGEALLAKGDFAGAMEAYAVASRADQNNQEHVQHYVMARRLIDFRNRLETEQSPERWEYLAKALRAFYAGELIYPELLKIDERIHARLNTADSAAMLAQTQLAMSQDAAAIKTLTAMDTSKATAMTQSLLGIALLRTGKMAEAKQIADKLELPADGGPAVTYAAARLHAGTGDSAKAMELLAKGFERTLPSQLEAFKSHAKQCPEFAAVAATPEFARVLETKSKMPESKCSGGSSCAGCPMSGKCPKSQGKQ